MENKMQISFSYVSSKKDKIVNIIFVTENVSLQCDDNFLITQVNYIEK